MRLMVALSLVEELGWVSPPPPPPLEYLLSIGSVSLAGEAGTVVWAIEVDRKPRRKFPALAGEAGLSGREEPQVVVAALRDGAGEFAAMGPVMGLGGV